MYEIVHSCAGIPYTTEYINKDNKPQKFLEISRRATGNPNARGTVPTIVGALFAFRHRLADVSFAPI